jgi:hypothetical protein
VPRSFAEIKTLYRRYSIEAVGVEEEPSMASSNEVSPSNGTTLMTSTDTSSGAHATEANTSEMTETTSEEPKDCILQLIDTLISHVYAILPSSFASEVTEVERWFEGVSSNGKKKQKEPQRENTTVVLNEKVAALTLDPSVFDGGTNVLYKLADKIVGLMGKGLPSSDERFLMSLDDGWPSWLSSVDSKEEKKVTFGLVLLAAFENSIHASYQRSLAKETENVGEVMLHMGGESSIITLRNLNSIDSTESNAVAKVDGELRRIFRLRKMLIENGEKFTALAPHEEWNELESNVKSGEGPFRPEHLLTIPLRWIVSSSSASENWNELMMGMWVKLAKGMSAGGLKKNQKIEEGKMEDIESIGETLASPSKKKKKKHKKKVCGEEVRVLLYCCVRFTNILLNIHL